MHAAAPPLLVSVAHCVSVQPLRAVAGDGVQLATPASGLVAVLHVVSTKLLPATGAAGVQEPTGVGPVSTWAQLVVV